VYTLTFKGLRGVISQRRQLFITTAVRTSNPGTKMFLYNDNHTAAEEGGIFSATNSSESG
jgi:hypothetical protein